jgi:transcriptional regulator with GAF, ATPase, and Fis domain
MTAVDSERQARNLKTLLGVAKALASEINLDNLLQVIVAKAAEVMDAERAMLFLYDQPRDELWSKTTQKLEINEIRIPLGVGIAGTVAKTRALINISDAYADPRFDSTFDKQTCYRTRSILCLPSAVIQRISFGHERTVSCQRCRPFGAADWMLKAAKHLGLISALNPCGRPRIA